MDLRAIAEADLADTLEGDFGLPVELVKPDGNRQIYSANDPTLLLRGQVLWDHAEENMDTGAPVIVPRPVVTLRRSSLERIPVKGETWGIWIPNGPDEDADKEFHILSDPLEGGRSLGVVRMYVSEVEQS